MSGVPFLSLGDVVIDEGVARRLPRHLALYHRALPIAQDDAITIVMAHPDNRAVIDVLRSVLGADVVVVRGDEREIQAALDRIYPTMSDDDHDAITTVTPIPAPDQIAEVLRTHPTSLLFVPDDRVFAPRRALCVLRGHTPDERLLRWTTRLAAQSSAQVTLLAVAGSGGFRVRGIGSLLDVRHAAGDHIAQCAQSVARAGLHGMIKLRHGDPFEQIAAEVSGGGYDLVTVAAEAYGDFVGRMCAAVNARAGSAMPGLLVVRSG
jgi:hypothetical protein